MQFCLRVVLFSVALGAMCVPLRAAESPFASWAAVVIAGDYQKRGTPIWGYDNARRDVAKALVSIGFDPARVRQFSSKPRWFAEKPAQTDIGDVGDALEEMAGQGATGCLFYLVSQGRQRGDIWFGDEMLTPDALNELLNDACGPRSTVVIISACRSGGFVPVLQGPNRFVFAASRADRTSFGCGVEEYPYFDACMLAAVPTAPNFPALARAVEACVSKRERETSTRWQSEPQLSIGATIGPLLERYTFHAAAR